MTEKEILANGFSKNEDRYAKFFKREGLTCVCVIYQKKSIRRFFERKTKPNYMVALSSIGGSDDCILCKANSIQDVEKMCDKFDPLSKKTNNLVLRLFVIVLLSIIISLFLKG